MIGADELRGSRPRLRVKSPRPTQPYLNLGGTFYFLISVLDGYSRFIVHWDICEKMEEKDVEMVLQKALEKHLEPSHE